MRPCDTAARTHLFGLLVFRIEALYRIESRFAGFTRLRAHRARIYDTPPACLAARQYAMCTPSRLPGPTHPHTLSLLALEDSPECDYRTTLSSSSNESCVHQGGEGSVRQGSRSRSNLWSMICSLEPGRLALRARLSPLLARQQPGTEADPPLVPVD